jgi:hypothetical protein
MKQLKEYVNLQEFCKIAGKKAKRKTISDSKKLDRIKLGNITFVSKKSLIKYNKEYEKIIAKCTNLERCYPISYFLLENLVSEAYYRSIRKKGIDFKLFSLQNGTTKFIKVSDEFELLKNNNVRSFIIANDLKKEDSIKDEKGEFVIVCMYGVDFGFF